MGERIRRLTVGISVLIAGATVAALCLVAASMYFMFPTWQALIAEHFQAMIGLPGCALVAFAVVVLLRQVDGAIEFEGLGFKFKGTSGQVAMWAACLLALAGALKLLW